MGIEGSPIKKEKRQTYIDILETKSLRAFLEDLQQLDYQEEEAEGWVEKEIEVEDNKEAIADIKLRRENIFGQFLRKGFSRRQVLSALDALEFEQEQEYEGDGDKV